jgi:hypothetical protein
VHGRVIRRVTLLLRLHVHTSEEGPHGVADLSGFLDLVHMPALFGLSVCRAITFLYY